ncbi:MAG: cytochrome c3 family protein [Nitrospiraceae bacterium]|nr:cytochrome c3 family protein [Nitrospiraceae bacterium]
MRRFLSCALSAAIVSLFFVLPSSAAEAPAKKEVDCSKCHAGLTAKKKVVHAAVSMGCPACHSGIDDALKVPHKKTTSFAKGLSADQPELCYGCHDKAKFTHTVVHAAIGMGCTACHNPHASDNEKLLIAPVPDLCMNCHDKAEFTKKNVHPPVADKMCLVCHDPHSSDNYALLQKAPSVICLDCHEEVAKRPHALAGFGGNGHSLGLPKAEKKEKKEPEGKKKEKMDPARQGKPFSCTSCHNPHSSDSVRLFRYPARTPMELCKNCHKY